MNQILLEIKNPIIQKIHLLQSKKLPIVIWEYDLIVQKDTNVKNRYFVNLIVNLTEDQMLICRYIGSLDVYNFLCSKGIKYCDIATAPGYMAFIIDYIHTPSLDLYSEVYLKMERLRFYYQYIRDNYSISQDKLVSN